MNMPQSTASQQNRALRFHELHNGPELLILPNAWDAGSAAIFEHAGFPAIGTTSAGIAYSLGRPDGERITLTELLESEGKIISRINVPLSVDMETGYGDNPAQVVRSVAAVIRAGAVGINIEDGLPGSVKTAPRLADMARQIELLAAVSEARAGTGVPFLLNARTDCYWLGIGTETEQLSVAIERSNAFLAAGADCVFVPGNLNSEIIAVLTNEIHGPLNVIAAPATPDPSELQGLGVARLSLGSGPARAAYAAVRRVARDLKQGSFASLLETGLSYDEANRLFG